VVGVELDLSLYVKNTNFGARYEVKIQVVIYTFRVKTEAA
jgi:hypothetical protein